MAPDGKSPNEPDDVRRRFQEALARKGGRGGGTGAANGGGPAKGHEHTAPAKAQRTFRRKSG